MKKCKTCNSEFSPKDKRKQYCSEKCKWRFENNKSLKKTLEKRKNIVVNDLADEYWKDVVGYEGIYKVSNLSRLKTVSREKKVLRNAMLLISFFLIVEAVLATLSKHPIYTTNEHIL